MDSISKAHIESMVAESRANAIPKRQFYDDFISFVESIWADPIEPPATGGCQKCEKDIEQ
jgi:hypothetical protein